MWATVDADYVQRLNDVGILFFHWREQLGEEVPCKVYRITHEWGSIWDHTHDYVQIWYVSKGAFLHSMAGNRYRMVAGNAFVIPPYAVHRVDMIPGEELEVIGIEFMPQFIDESYTVQPDGPVSIYREYLQPFLTSEEHVRPKVTLLGADDLEVRRILDALMDEYHSKQPHYGLHLRAHVIALLAVLIRVYAGDMERDLISIEDVNHRAIMETVSFINQHFTEDLRLESVCRRAMMSKTYFCDLFKEATGKTFTQYLSDLRLRRAMRLLLDRNLNVSDVARMVGFNDVSYFSRKFRQVVGVPPSQYRRHAVREMPPREDEVS